MVISDSNVNFTSGRKREGEESNDQIMTEILIQANYEYDHCLFH